jgi:flagellar hook-associated protein 3 FlgL
MRISSSGLLVGAVNAMIEQQAALARTQNQVATGNRVNNASDDPIAAVRILDLTRTQAESDQFGKNSDIARGRLSEEEQALSDSTSMLQSVRDLVVQAANTATLSDSDRKAIAAELSQKLEQLTAIANRKDSNGDYLFSGMSARTQPFTVNGTGGVNYVGDQSVRNVQIGPGQTVVDGHSGYDVFMNITQGNGTFVTGASSSNTGTGIMSAGSVTNAAAWVPDNYTLSFTAANTWQVVNSASTVVATGTYTSGSAIAFNGVQVNITGVPATGDSFSISKSGSEDVFATMNKLIGALSQPSTSPAPQAQLDMILGQGLQQLDQIGDHLSDVRSQVGARLTLLDDGDDARANLKVDLQTSISNLRDLDYGQAVTQLNQQLTGLQAAQLSYTKIAGLSLFNYMR